MCGGLRKEKVIHGDGHPPILPLGAPVPPGPRLSSTDRDALRRGTARRSPATPGLVPGSREWRLGGGPERRPSCTATGWDPGPGRSGRRGLRRPGRAPHLRRVRGRRVSRFRLCGRPGPALPARAPDPRYRGPPDRARWSRGIGRGPRTALPGTRGQCRSGLRGSRPWLAHLSGAPGLCRRRERVDRAPAGGRSSARVPAPECEADAMGAALFVLPDAAHGVHPVVSAGGAEAPRGDLAGRWPRGGCHLTDQLAHPGADPAGWRRLSAG